MSSSAVIEAPRDADVAPTPTAAAGSDSWAASWHRTLDRVVALRDRRRANRLITESHDELSQALAGVLGRDAGANFHTWAVWGSREAGTTIAARDIRGFTAIAAAAAALLAAGSTRALGGRGLLVLVITMGGAAAAAAIARARLARASRCISHGNRIVLEEIGGATVDYVAAVESGDVPAFLAGLRPGRSEDGGQQMLRDAFEAYESSRHEPRAAQRHQLVFAANCLAVWHEHVRLQRDIARAMPRPFRRLITRTLLDFRVGPEPMHVAHDVVPHVIDLAGGATPGPYPTTLAVLDEPVALRIDAAMRRSRRVAVRGAQALVGSGASDWSVMADRMNYVVDLFRSRHLDPDVFDHPYESAALASFATA
jgi:hypothetical protein